MMQPHKSRRELHCFVVSFLQVLLISACVSSSRTPENVPSSAPQKSARVTKISDLPATGAWRRIQFVNDENCFFSTPNSLWRSINAGKTWEILHHTTDFRETITRVQFLDATFGWMETHSGWYKSENGGRNWVPFETPLSSSGRLSEVKFISRDIGWIAGAALRPASREELGSGSVPNVPRHLLDDITKKILTPIIYRTDDAGKTWRVQTVPASLGNIEDISFIDSDHGIALSGPGAFHTRDGGKTWLKAHDPRTCIGNEDDGVYEGKPSWPYLLDSSYQWIAFDDGRMLRTNNDGQTWVEVQPCDQSRPLVVHFSSQIHGIGLGLDGSLYETANAGSQWVKIDTNKYESLSFLGNQRVWLVSERGLFRVNIDVDP